MIQELMPSLSFQRNQTHCENGWKSSNDKEDHEKWLIWGKVALACIVSSIISLRRNVSWYRSIYNIEDAMKDVIDWRQFIRFFFLGLIFGDCGESFF